MKIIKTDNFDRDSVADVLLLENVPESLALAFATTLNSEVRSREWWYQAVADDYRLSRGMEDLV